jgi:hypothetical protein
LDNWLHLWSLGSQAEKIFKRRRCEFSSTNLWIFATFDDSAGAAVFGGRLMRACLIFCFLLFLSIVNARAQRTRLESVQNKTILVFTPHPDDDVFGAGGTIALLNRNHNKVYIVVYTNDDKGSYDPDMSSQHLARIRRSEQEVSEGQLGTPKENIMWMGYDDGMLEYAPQPKLTEEATARRRKPITS